MHRTQKEALFDLMVERLRDFAIILLDAAGRVLGWNAGAERMLGYHEAEILGQHFSLFFIPEDVEAGRPEHELAQATAKGSVEDDNWLLRKDGSRLYVSGITTVLASGGIRGYSKIFRDLSDRKRLEDETRRYADQLADANRRKDEFLAMLSHELRNPLAPIMNALQIMRHDPSDNPVSQQARQIIERQVRRLTRLIEDLLDLARVSSGKIELRPERVELSVILERAVETVKPLIEAHQHHFSLSLPAEPVWLQADPARLEQVVSNLLTNAAKYTRPAGRIWLSAAKREDRALINVRDTGVGITPELLPHVFELFTQDERTRDRAQGGLGIGLKLVKSLVEMHGGSVRAHSGGPGQGSEFCVELPAAAPSPAPATTLPGAGARASGALKVLIVDDSLDVTDSLAMLLKLQHYVVATANDGISAVREAQEFGPDVIFLDIALHGADGLIVAQRIHELPQLREVVLVAMTAHGQDRDRRLSREAGFDHHLTKPIDPLELGELLALLAARR